MLFDIPFIADWKKIGEHMQCYLILTLPVKMKAGLIMITKLARKYLYGMKIYSAKHSPYGKKTHGQLRQSIQMEQSQFNAEIN
jgi:hypothetical protein